MSMAKALLLLLFGAFATLFVSEASVCPDGASCCPNENEDVGWYTCDAQNPCTGSDRICVPAPPVFRTRYPELKICARKPCHSNSSCKPGRYCYKKYSNGHPTIDSWGVKGICCERI